MKGVRPQWAVKAIFLVIMASMLFRGASAINHTVGGVSGWDLTSDIQAWTSRTTFHVGDSLVFSYTPVHDVLEVEEEDYRLCEVSEPIRTYNDGETVIPLTQEGSRYFICGRQGHCTMGLKLEAQVLASSANANETRTGGGTPGTPNHPPRSRSPPPLPSPPPSPKGDGGNGQDIEIPTGSPSPTHAPGPNSASPSNFIIVRPLVIATLLPVVIINFLLF